MISPNLWKYQYINPMWVAKFLENMALMKYHARKSKNERETEIENEEILN